MKVLNAEEARDTFFLDCKLNGIVVTYSIDDARWDSLRLVCPSAYRQETWTSLQKQDILTIAQSVVP